MLTIKQVADYVGVTIRAVRHYHAVGLLTEPERDAAGYRRYGAQAVADLARIKALAEAGVPLAQVQTLLQATPDEFAAALEGIDGRLRAEIDRLQHSRERVARLAHGDRLVLPDEVIEYLDRLSVLGVSERAVRMEREAWIVVAVRAPDRAAAWATAKRQQLQDPVFRSLYLAFDRAFEMSPDDPQLVELADDLVGFLPSVEPLLGGSQEEDVSEHLVPLLDNGLPASPAWTRLMQLVEQRGCTGWTQMGRTGKTRY